MLMVKNATTLFIGHSFRQAVTLGSS